MLLKSPPMPGFPCPSSMSSSSSSLPSMTNPKRKETPTSVKSFCLCWSCPRSHLPSDNPCSASTPIPLPAATDVGADNDDELETHLLNFILIIPFETLFDGSTCTVSCNYVSHRICMCRLGLFSCRFTYQCDFGEISHRKNSRLLYSVRSISQPSASPDISSFSSLQHLVMFEPVNRSSFHLLR